MTYTIRNGPGAVRCGEAAAAAVIAAALRNAHTVTVQPDDSPTRWRFRPTVRGTTVEALNPSLFTPTTEPPPWATRLAAAADRLI